jgi:hypothetical protein
MSEAQPLGRGIKDQIYVVPEIEAAPVSTTDSENQMSRIDHDAQLLGVVSIPISYLIAKSNEEVETIYAIWDLDRPAHSVHNSIAKNIFHFAGRTTNLIRRLLDVEGGLRRYLTLSRPSMGVRYGRLQTGLAGRRGFANARDASGRSSANRDR